jgi:sulfite reductase beta subunit-like hemoprotein
MDCSIATADCATHLKIVTSIELDYTEEQNLLICDIVDQTLEAAATTEKETLSNITWCYCPTGLTICRF